MGVAVFPPCCLTWGQTTVEVLKIKALFQKVPCMHCCSQCLQPCSRPPLTHASAKDSWTLTGMSGSVSRGVTAPFSWVLVHTSFCLCLPWVCFPVLCKFWWLYGGVNGNLLQEGLCHTQVSCTQSPGPAAAHCWPVPLQETLKHFLLSLCGVSGSWCTQGLFEPS